MSTALGCPQSNGVSTPEDAVKAPECSDTIPDVAGPRKIGSYQYTDDTWKTAVKVELKARKWTFEELAQRVTEELNLASPVNRSTISKMLRLKSHPDHQTGNRFAPVVSQLLNIPMAKAPTAKDQVDEAYAALKTIELYDLEAHSHYVSLLKKHAATLLQKKRSR